LGASTAGISTTIDDRLNKVCLLFYAEALGLIAFHQFQAGIKEISARNVDAKVATQLNAVAVGLCTSGSFDYSLPTHIRSQNSAQ
jgi:hypothetical protein